MQYWINDPAVGGLDDKINPPAADHYSISGANSEAQKIIFILSVYCINFKMLRGL